MKKTKKCDFKKLALLGLAGGAILSTEASADIINTSELLAFNGCGGSHGCNGQGVGSKGGGSYQAYRNVPSQNSNYYSQQSSGCAAATSPQYYQQSSGCHAASAPQYYQQSSGCHASSASQGQYYQPSQGCGGYSAPQYNQPSSGYNTASTSQGQNYQISQGCGGYSAPQGQNSQPQRANQMQAPIQAPAAPAATSANQGGAYTQWETGGYTADAAKYNTQSGAATTKSTNQRTLTESELLSQLNEQSKAAYKGLDAAGKALALKMANQSCKNENECKGMNSCKNKEHSCAGKGSCAGTADSNFKDKNLAVKVAALKMAEKRANAASPK